MGSWLTGKRRAEQEAAPSGKALGWSNPVLKANISLRTIASFWVCGIRIRAPFFLLLREINWLCVIWEFIGGYTHSFYVFNKDRAHTLDPLSLQLSFLLSAFCPFAARVRTHMCMHKNHRRGEITHQTQPVWKRLSKRMNPFPSLKSERTWDPEMLW